MLTIETDPFLRTNFPNILCAGDVAGQPGALPLLQYALTELFERRQGNVMTKAAYEESGGALAALSRRADSVYATLDEAGKAVARQLFLRLVTLGEGVDDMRRRMLRSELRTIQVDKAGVSHDQTSAVLEEIADIYGRYRLLSFDRDPITRSPTVEVAHESLIREWPRLRAWVEDHRQELAAAHRLDAMVVEWEAHDRDRGYLIREGRLAQFEEFAASTSLIQTIGPPRLRVSISRLSV